MALKLYYNPGSCSMASHAALIEAALPYEIERVDLTVAANEALEYLTRNPWGRVPALGIGDEVLTENVAILTYIADQAPERSLLPAPGTLERARAMEWLALLSSTVHIAFRPVLRPNRFALSEAGQGEVVSAGIAALDAVLAKLEAQLCDRPYVLGDRFSLVDVYLFVFLFWSKRPNVAGKLSPRPKLDERRVRLLERQSIRRALTEEGLEIPSA